MLNQERIRLMTKMAIYEQGEGKEYLPVCHYYGKDYVSLQMIKTLLYSTVAFAILFILGILYDLENWMGRLSQINVVKLGAVLLLYYLIYEVVFQAAALIIYNRKYAKARKSAKRYLGKLRKVEKLYAQEEKMTNNDEKQQ